MANLWLACIFIERIFCPLEMGRMKDQRVILREGTIQGEEGTAAQAASWCCW